MQSRASRLSVVLFAAACGMGIGPPANAQDAALESLSLEELVTLEVLTVSRKAQKLSDTPAAVTVVTAEDIRRSGARTIPEALRQVPGVEVAQIDAGRYAVSVRGFNGRFANKLLVQVDGRSVYSPYFSGVFWEALNLMMEDIERIEVIRGPGAALWGANAVNGVINIVSRRASATQGTLLSLSVDDQGKPTVAARYGTTVPDIGALRLYAKGEEVSPSKLADGSTANDAGAGWRAGFRLDSARDSRRSWTLQGEAYRQRNDETFLLPDVAAPQSATAAALGFHFEGAHLQGRTAFDVAGGEMSLQGYVERNTTTIATVGDGQVDTADVDFQHRLAPWERHEILWGLGYRRSQSKLPASGIVVQVAPRSRDVSVTSAFLQDEVTLDPGVWKLTLGAKVERSNLFGTELQPNARLLWTPTPADSVWAGWSRAVRTPSIGENDATFLAGTQPTPPGTPFPFVTLYSRRLPGYSMAAERLDATELGYRHNLGNGSVEAVAFVHDYTRLLGAASDPSGPALPGTIPLPFPPFSIPNVYLDRSNDKAGRSHGLELALDVPLSAQVRLQATYTYIDIDLDHYVDPVADANARMVESATPRHSATLRLATNPAAGHELDVLLRYVGSVQAGQVPAYSSVDLRYGWKVNRNFELALIGQNLFNPSHVEFVTDFLPSPPVQQPRRAFLQGIWRF